MITQWTRIFLTDNGVLTDFTLAAQNSDTMALPLVNAEDYVYIGQHYPFNNFFAEVNTANSNAATWDIEVWDGTAYQTVVDVLDETEQSGAPWARSGVIQFSPDIDETWQLVLDTSDSDGPTGLITALGTTHIYNLYWMRFRPSADLSAGTVLNRIGYRFANTEMLNSIDPDLSRYLTSWESGKTDWDEQLILASNHVIADMKARGIIVHPGQALRIDELALPTAYRALTLIYSVLGPDFEFRRAHAQERYQQLMSVQRFTIDQTRDGTEDSFEHQNSPAGILVR